MHTVAELVAHANALGLVTRSEVLDGVVSVAPAAADPQMRAVLVCDRPVVYVKEPEPASAPETVGALERERTALSSLGDVDLGPRLLPDQLPDAMWVDVVRGRVLPEVRATIPELAEICETWGVAVARLHRLSTTRPGVPDAPRPWLLDADRRARVAGRVPSGASRRRLALAVDEDPWLRAAGRRVAARWTDRHWIHGGLSAEHVIVETTPPVRVRFSHFENAGLGDPCWDLAMACDAITSQAPRWRTPAEPLIDYFLRGYRRAGGPGTLFPAVQAISALAVGWQLVDSDLTSGLDTSFWLDRARGFAGRPARAA